MNRLSPPKGWGDDSVTEFFETARENSFATFVKLPADFKRLVDINDLSFSAIEYTKTTQDPKQWFALLFFAKAHSAFIGAISLAAATQIPEAFMVLRGVLETIIYGWYINQDPDYPKLLKLWLDRHESNTSKAKVQEEFRPSRILNLLKKSNRKLGKIVWNLYERTIDYGAHPNERSLTVMLKQKKEQDLINIEIGYITDYKLLIQMCLKTSAQVGVASLKIMELIFPEKFQTTELSEKLNTLSKGL